MGNAEGFNEMGRSVSCTQGDGIIDLMSEAPQQREQVKLDPKALLCAALLAGLDSGRPAPFSRARLIKKMKRLTRCARGKQG